MTEAPWKGKLRVDDAEVMRLWRKAGLPEYFLGNSGTNVRLVAFAHALCDAANSGGEGGRVKALEIARGVELKSVDGPDPALFRIGWEAAKDTIISALLGDKPDDKGE